MLTAQPPRTKMNELPRIHRTCMNELPRIHRTYMNELPRIHCIYKHTRTGGLYEVLHNSLSKRGDGLWEMAVVYKHLATRETFVRDTRSFMARFEEQPVT